MTPLDIKDLAKEHAYVVETAENGFVPGDVIFHGDDLLNYTNAVVERCKEHIHGENAYCAVMLDELKVKI